MKNLSRTLLGLILSVAASTVAFAQTDEGAVLDMGFDYSGYSVIYGNAVPSGDSNTSQISGLVVDSYGLVGTVGGALTINSGGHLAPGNSVGSISTQTPTLATYGSQSNSDADDFTVISGSLTLNSGGDSGVLFNLGDSSVFSAPGTYNIFSYGMLSNPSSPISYTFINDTTDKLINLPTSYTYVGESPVSLSGGFTTQALPEPPVIDLLFCAAGIFLLVLTGKNLAPRNRV